MFTLIIYCIYIEVIASMQCVQLLPVNIGTLWENILQTNTLYENILHHLIIDC